MALLLVVLRPFLSSFPGPFRGKPHTTLLCSYSQCSLSGEIIRSTATPAIFYMCRTARMCKDLTYFHPSRHCQHSPFLQHKLPRFPNSVDYVWSGQFFIHTFTDVLMRASGRPHSTGDVLMSFSVRSGK